MQPLSDIPKPKKSITDWALTGLVGVASHIVARVVWELLRPYLGF